MNLTIRWTVGDVSRQGLEALALSIEGAHAIFGAAAQLVVCANSIDLCSARERVGPAAHFADWVDCSTSMPTWLSDHMDGSMAQGVAWKFASLSLFQGRRILSLDNDVILWRMPDSIQAWLDEPDAALIAEDVRCCYGQFATHCPSEARNSGITGIPAEWDYQQKLRDRLQGVRLTSEADEQGLQTAVLTAARHKVVPLSEVSISGYFRPHMLELGSCGAHFVGVNVKRTATTWNERPCEVYIYEYWDYRKSEVERLVREQSRSADGDSVASENGCDRTVEPFSIAM
jgi:hypothetical protein